MYHGREAEVLVNCLPSPGYRFRTYIFGNLASGILAPRRRYLRYKLAFQKRAGDWRLSASPQSYNISRHGNSQYSISCTHTRHFSLSRTRCTVFYLLLHNNTYASCLLSKFKLDLRRPTSISCDERLRWLTLIIKTVKRRRRYGRASCERGRYCSGEAVRAAGGSVHRRK